MVTLIYQTNNISLVLLTINAKTCKILNVKPMDEATYNEY